MGTITAANSIYMLSVASLYTSAQQLQGYAADAAFDTENVDLAEVVLGVDGRMSAGWVPFLTKQQISLMPDSPSNVIFDTWMAQQTAQREIFYGTGIITLPSISMSYTLSQGVLMALPPIPSVKKVLTARVFSITWGSIVGAPTA